MFHGLSMPLAMKALFQSFQLEMALIELGDLLTLVGELDPAIDFRTRRGPECVARRHETDLFSWFDSLF